MMVYGSVVMFLGNLSDIQMYRAEGQVSDGYVEEVVRGVCIWEAPCRHRQRRTRITYRFETSNGRAITRTKLFLTSEFRDLAPGMSVPVAYLPSAPDRNWISPSNVGFNALRTALICWLVTLAMALISFRDLRKAIYTLDEVH